MLSRRSGYLGGSIQTELNVPFLLGFWLDANEDEIPNLDDRFGWARLERNNANTLVLLDSAIEDTGVGIYAGTLQPVPEPASILLAAFGLLALLLTRRKNPNKGDPREAGTRTPKAQRRPSAGPQLANLGPHRSLSSPRWQDSAFYSSNQNTCSVGLLKTFAMRKASASGGVILFTTWASINQSHAVSTTILNWLIWSQFATCFGVRGLVSPGPPRQLPSRQQPTTSTPRSPIYLLNLIQVHAPLRPPDTAESMSEFMSLKPQPNHQRYLEVLRAMSPADRLRKACELSDLTRQLLRAGLKASFPHLSEAELHKLYLERIAACRNSEY